MKANLFNFELFDLLSFFVIQITINRPKLNGHRRFSSPARKFVAVGRDVERSLLLPDVSRTSNRLAMLNALNCLVGKRNIRAVALSFRDLLH